MNDAAPVSMAATPETPQRSSSSDFAELTRRLEVYMRSLCPLVIVRTAERHRVERALADIVGRSNLNAWSYSDSRQVVRLNQDAAPHDVHSDPLPFVRETFLRTRRTAFLLADTRRMDQDTLYTRELVSTAYLAQETHNTLIVVTADDVWQRLAGMGMVVDLGTPTFEERCALITDFARRNIEKVSLGPDSTAHLSVMLRGLSEMQITNLLRASLVAQGRLDDSSIDSVSARKDRLFTSVPNVMPVDCSQPMLVVGLTGLRSWLERKRRVFFASREQLDAHHLEPPRGILLMGVPGCGKSYSARMVAHEWRLPLFRFDLGSVYDKYVGETERRMQEALDYIDNVAPCVLWIDEIDKALSVRSGESDVANRVLGQFLFWLQESDAKVFLVATANNVADMPPELFRKGRFSETFFVDLPTRAERHDAIGAYVASCLGTQLDDAALGRLADECAGFSYSDIEQCVKDVAEGCWFGGPEGAGVAADPTAVEARLAQAMRQAAPINPEAIQRIREWGERNARPASDGDAAPTVASSSPLAAPTAAMQTLAGRTLAMPSIPTASIPTRGQE